MEKIPKSSIVVTTWDHDFQVDKMDPIFEGEGDPYYRSMDLLSGSSGSFQ